MRRTLALCALLACTPASALVPSRFNAVDTGNNAVSGVTITKVSGTSFSLDLVAINLAGTGVDPTYTGTVTVTLLDASNNSGAPDAFGCRPTWTSAQALGTTTFTLINAGRKALSGIVYANALRVARLKVVDNGLGVSGCSSDAFAIRPSTFALAASDATATTAGTTRTLNALTAAATPTHHAGRPFTLIATAKNSSGVTTSAYNGTPAATVSSSVLGAALGTLTGGTWSTSAGASRSDDLAYGQAGAVRLQVQDTTFAAVDAGDGSTPAQRTIGPVTIDAGRFTPDDFSVALNTPRFTPACSTFTWLGQPFAYATTPVATLTAINASGGTTTNYTGTLFKLVAGSVTGKQYLAGGGATVDSSGLTGAAVTIADGGAGIATLAFDAASGARLALTRSTPVVPFNAELRLEASVTDSDAVAYSANPLAFGSVASGGGIAFGAAGTTKQVRFGVLSLVNAYGSERLPLDVPLRLRYWQTVSGSTGYVAAGDDTCTTAGTILPAHVTLDETALGNGSSGQTSVSSITLSAGSGAIRLAAPLASGRVGVTLNLLPSYPWLRPDANADNSYADAAAASASFGLFADDARRVYRREVLR